MSRLSPALVSLLLAALMAPLAASAHEPGLSSTLVWIGRHSIDARVKVRERDLGNAVLDSTALRMELDERPAALLSAEPVASEAGHSELRLRYARPEGRRLRVVSVLLSELPFGHKQYLRVEDEGGRVLADRILGAAAPSWKGELQPPSETSVSVAAGFFSLGVRHIATGYDHLLFLFALLIASRGLRPIARIVTTFTLAHSLTLVAASRGWLSLSPDLVEPAIAASIVVVAALNLLGEGRARERLALTFGFGLVHGLGFAGALAELGVGASAVPLVAFNLGVEAGQVVIAATVLPGFAWLCRSAAFLRAGVPACSALVGALGLAWLIERTWLA